jgi:probable F420-dependent oxidoreductase
MTRPDLGRLGVWGHLDTLDAAAVRVYARRVDELGYGALWVPETVGREPFALLAALAGETASLVLGTSIVNIWGRDPQATRMAAMTLAELTSNRFVLGLGVSHPHLAGKLRGHTYEKPLTRMREYLAGYRRAIYRGPSASEPVIEPLILLAALRERMTGLAATDADGAYPYLVAADRVRWMRDRLDAASGGAPDRPVLAVTLPVVLADRPGDAAAREAARAYLGPYLRTPAYQASWALQGFADGDWAAPGSDRLVEAMVAIGGVDAADDRIEELLAAGADHVAVIPIDPAGRTEHLPTLEALAR